MKCLHVTLLVFFLSFISFGQERQIKGQVSDENGNPLPFVNILIKGTAAGTSSDYDGQFTLEVSDTNAVLVFTSMGYETQEISVGGKTVINVEMKPDLNQLGEVILTVQAKGQKKAIQEQINSNTIKNVVASDRLQENPDANSVEALGRLPGVSVTRSGGEGNGIIVRGLQPKYTNVTLNGVKMAATGGGGRETNIAGISQYALQGAEVYKSLTADMEANSVAGTINLKLRETQKGLHGNIMATGGYNNLNKEYGNYRYQAEIGNRFFNDKLGAFMSLSAESVNRSTQTIGASYEHAENNDTGGLDFYINNTVLNLVNRYNDRKSTMLSLDYRLGSMTKLGAYVLYNRSSSDGNNQSKNYLTTGSGGVFYNFDGNTNRKNEIFQSALNAETNLEFLKLDYGVSLSSGKTRDPKSRSWAFYAPNASELTDAIFSRPFRKELHPEDVPPLYRDDNQSINDFVLNNANIASEFMTDRNVDAYLNLTIPIEVGNQIKINMKTGYAYRKKDRLRDVTGGTVSGITNQFFRDELTKDENLSWLVADPLTEFITAEGLQSGSIDDFLQGAYNFGPTFNFDRLNEITDSWTNTSNFWYNQGEDVWSERFPKDKLGFSQNILSSVLNDQDIAETYNAGYAMAEIKIKDWLMFLPGVRYEKTNADMKGFVALQPTLPGPVNDPIPGRDSIASRSNDFILPMVHLRISPKKWFYTHLAYTETLSRPLFDQISPNSWTNTGFPPFAFYTKAPNLEVEQWKNFDAQLTFHTGKLGLLSISGFYKTVNNQIWERTFTRIKGDPLIEPFPDASQVIVNRPENHPNEIKLKGFEIDLQASFGYLSNFLKYFTVSANYTFTDSKTYFPISKIEEIITPNPNGGRPTVVVVRNDSLVSGPMLFQPRHIVNTSLGFNKKGTNIWMSFQFNGGILDYTHPQFNELDILKREFYRWDLQVTQKLFGQLKGFQIIANLANLNDILEFKKLRGEPRPLFEENYGWTADIGLRYSF